MKKTKFLAIVLAILFLATTFISSNVFATATAYTATSIAVDDTVKTLTITRTIGNVTNPVINTFDYEIELVSKPTTAAITGLPTTIGETMTLEDLISFDGSESYSTGNVVETGALNLASATFNEVGDYIFKVTESASQYETTYPRDTKEYYFYISVRNKVVDNVPTGELEVKLAPHVGENAGDGLTKTENLDYTSDSQHTYIELTKNVTGNNANKHKYFPFEITFTNDNIQVGDKLYVSIDGGSYYTTGNQYVTVEAGKKITVYAKHGETITIGKTADELCQLPIGTTYTIEEKNYDNTESYTTTIDGTTTAKTVTKTTVEVATAGDQTSVDAFETNNTTEYVNNREASVLTGLFINIMPFVLLVAVAFVGIILIKKSSKKED